MGRALNITDEDLDQIVNKDPKDISEQSYQIMRKWYQANGHNATYSALAQALLDRTVNMGRVANEFCFA